LEDGGLEVSDPRGVLTFDRASIHMMTMKVPMVDGRIPNRDTFADLVNESHVRENLARDNSRLLGGYATVPKNQLQVRARRLTRTDFSFVVPNRLWRVDPPACFAPLRLTSSYGGQKIFDLTDPKARAVAYAWLIRDGSPMALREYVDGALLADAWPQVARHLSEQMRHEWAPVVLEAGEGWLIERLLSGRPRR